MGTARCSVAPMMLRVLVGSCFTAAHGACSHPPATCTHMLLTPTCFFLPPPIPQIPALQKALPSQDVSENGHMDTDDHEEVHRMSTVEDIESELKARIHMGKGGSGGEAYDSDDDDDMPRGQRVQCAQS